MDNLIVNSDFNLKQKRKLIYIKASKENIKFIFPIIHDKNLIIGLKI